MIQKMIDLLAQAEKVYLAGIEVELQWMVAPTLVELQWMGAPLTGEPDNQVIRLAWEDDSADCSTVLTESGLGEARFDESTGILYVNDYEGSPMCFKLRMPRPAERVAPEAEAVAYIVIQEGGSSTERYVHIHDSEDSAKADRIDCAAAAYRTSDIIKVPKALANQEGFLDAVVAVVQATLSFDYPEET